MAVERPKLVGVAAYPRVAASIRKSKARAGLAGFAIAFVASHLNGASFSSSCWRALAGGVAAYLVTWAAAVTIWRHIVIAKVRASIARARGRSGSSA